MNFAVTDGKSVVVTRYNNVNPKDAASLYFSSGTSFECVDDKGRFTMAKSDKREHLVIVASGTFSFSFFFFLFFFSFFSFLSFFLFFLFCYLFFLLFTCLFNKKEMDLDLDGTKTKTRFLVYLQVSCLRIVLSSFFLSFFSLLLSNNNQTMIQTLNTLRF